MDEAGHPKRFTCCRRHAPTTVRNGPPFPLMKIEDWCGEWETKEADQEDDRVWPPGRCYNCKYVEVLGDEGFAIYRCTLRDSFTVVDPVKDQCVGWDPEEDWENIPYPVVPATPVNRFETGELVCGEEPGQVNNWGFQFRQVQDFESLDVKIEKYPGGFAKVVGGKDIEITKEEAIYITEWMRKGQA